LSEPKNEKDTIDVAAKNAMVENELLKKENLQLRAQLDSVQKALVRVQETVESQERAKMVPIILANTNMTREEVLAMDTESMFSLTETFRILKRPPAGVAGVKPAIDAEDTNSRLTVPGKFRFGPKGVS